jgi:hypothetical protein
MRSGMGTSDEKETPITPTANTVKRPKRSGRSWLFRLGLPAVVLAGLAGLSLLVSACGGSPGRQVAQLGSTTSTSPTTQSAVATATGKYAAALAYSRCMRSHGVSNFPDPKHAAGGGIQISGSRSGMNPQSPLFMDAQQSCRHLLPGGGQPTHAGLQQALARMLHVSQCMRAHGISGFPDPTLSPPSNRAGYGQIRSNGVAWLAIPDSIDARSPLFKLAAAACKL